MSDKDTCGQRVGGVPRKRGGTVSDDTEHMPIPADHRWDPPDWDASCGVQAEARACGALLLANLDRLPGDPDDA